jgi:hypothetical protein
MSIWVSPNISASPPVRSRGDERAGVERYRRQRDAGAGVV